ncbi:hypothetical protein [Endozoicomonas sp. ONNA1]|uniref:hypothetical protein n=1 Tax=Endozoicomonas sp. ONNA1 TaxID=2828740 RepID=UPI00214843D2|nr:hypothetical protein [Endozoicomonas sp. ONNA1]
MTTVAYDGRYLATDSQATGSDGEIAPGEYTKIALVEGTFKGEPLVAIAYAGNPFPREEYLDWVAAGAKREEYSEDWDGLMGMIVTNANAYYIDYKGFSMRSNSIAAMGSGQTYALSAMYLGRGAAQAVHHAIQRDAYSGGSIKMLDCQSEQPSIQIVSQEESGKW